MKKEKWWNKIRVGGGEAHSVVMTSADNRAPDGAHGRETSTPCQVSQPHRLNVRFVLTPTPWSSLL
jgi:hypothetical protein